MQGQKNLVVSTKNHDWENCWNFRPTHAAVLYQLSPVNFC